MSPTEPAAVPPPPSPPLLCVSIHDVAPSTWDDCARLAAALREVADRTSENFFNLFQHAKA